MQKPLFDLAPDSLCRQIMKVDLPAEGDRRFIDREFETRSKLHGTQHTKTVLDESLRIDGAKDSKFEICLSAVGIDELFRQRIVHYRVDGEIAAA